MPTLSAIRALFLRVYQRKSLCIQTIRNDALRVQNFLYRNPDLRKKIKLGKMPKTPKFIDDWKRGRHLVRDESSSDDSSSSDSGSSSSGSGSSSSDSESGEEKAEGDVSSDESGEKEPEKPAYW